MNKRTVYFSYIIAMILSMFLIQCSDLNFKGSHNVDRSSQGDGELNRNSNIETGDITASTVTDNFGQTGNSDSNTNTETGTTKDPDPEPMDFNQTDEPAVIDTKLSLNSISNTMIGKNVTISGNLKDKDGKAIAGATIKLKINNQNKPSTQTNTTGKFSFSYKVQASGNHSVTVSYDGDNIHNASKANKNFKGSKIPTDISVTVLQANINVGDTVTVQGKLLDTDNNPMKDASIIVYINGDQQTVTTNTSGLYSRTYKVTNSGKHDIKAIYRETNKYAQSEASTSFTVIRVDEPPVVVEKINTNISLNYPANVLVGQSVTISGTLRDNSQNPIANASIRLEINGSNQSKTTNNNGKFFLSYIVAAAGTHTVVATYNGNDKYNGSTVSGSFIATAPKLDTFLELKIGDGRATYSIGDTVVLHGSLFKNEDTSGVPNANLVLKVNNQTFSVTTGQDGHFEYPYLPQALGTYEVTVSFAGNDQYNPANDDEDSFIVVEKPAPEITIQTQDILAGENETIIVNMPGVTNEIITIDVDGEGSHPGIFVANGQASLTIKNPPVGIYPVTVTFAGNNQFKSATASGIFAVLGLKRSQSCTQLGLNFNEGNIENNVNPKVTTLGGDRGRVMINGDITDLCTNGGTAIPYAPVSITVNYYKNFVTEYYPKFSDSGKATVGFDYTATNVGIYHFIVKYDGDGTHDAATFEAFIKVIR